MVEDEDPRAASPEARALLLSYAMAMAAEVRSSPHRVGRLRQEYCRARSALPDGIGSLPAGPVTAETWYGAFVEADVPRADLELALSALAAGADPHHGHLRSLLDRYTAWTRARADPRLSRQLLQAIALAARPGRPPTIVDPSVGLRRAALFARRRHPGIQAIAPDVFAALFASAWPSIDAEPLPSLPAKGSADSQGSAEPERKVSAASVVSIYFLIVGVLGIVRLCSEPPKSVTPRQAPEVQGVEDVMERHDAPARAPEGPPRDAHGQGSEPTGPAEGDRR